MRALHGRAEPHYRRALAIGQANFPPTDTRIATRLNNLTQLLQATNRVREAEPLMRRVVAIFLAFERDTGHAHPHREAVIRNYAGLLVATGKSETEIRSAIETLQRDARLMRA